MRPARFELTTSGLGILLSGICAYPAPFLTAFMGIKTGYPLRSDSKQTPARDETGKKDVFGTYERRIMSLPLYGVTAKITTSSLRALAVGDSSPNSRRKKSL